MNFFVFKSYFELYYHNVVGPNKGLNSVPRHGIYGVSKDCCWRNSVLYTHSGGTHLLLESSLKEKTGQLLITGFEGTTLNPGMKDLIVNRGIGGVILFERNYQDPEQLSHMIGEMQELALSQTGGVPLFISVDQEGGRVSRLKKPFSAFPFQSFLGKAGSEDLAFRFGQALGLELSKVGINVDYAPVLDANTNPDNPIIGERAISDQPETTARLGLAVIRGFLASGVLPVGKHFPGHGDTSLDSHLDLPVVQKAADQLEREELVPFVRAIHEDLPLLMTAHVVYPAWDDKVPATFSKFILRDILRKRLGYQGLVVSDDLEMKAVQDHLQFEYLAELGLEAGLDLFMICQHTGKTIALQEQMIEAVESGRVNLERIDESVRRILHTKQRIAQTACPKELEALSTSHQKLIEEITAHS